MLIKFSVLKIFLLVLIVETSWVLSTEPKMASTLNIPMKSTSLASLYRSPRDGFARSLDSGSSLGRSAVAGRTGRFFSDYFGSRNPTYNYANRYSAYDRNGNYGTEDRNWYYQPDRYDNRYWYDDRYSNRNDDRYDGYNRNYDRYDSRYPSTYNSYDYRGNGYDNRDPIYYDRDRYNYGTSGDRYDSRTYYDRDTYDRYPMTSRYSGSTGYYDYKNYRPWDETYRGVSGFDNSGRGYYFANNPQRDSYPSRQPPPSHSSMGSTSPYYNRPPSSSQSHPNDINNRDHHYSNNNHQAPPRPIQSGLPNSNPNYESNSSGSNSDNNNNNNYNNSNYNNNNNNNSSSSNYNNNANSNENDRPDRPDGGRLPHNGNKPSYAVGWDYNESDRNRNQQNMPQLPPAPVVRDHYYPDDRREMEQTGNPYGTRTRPVIGGMGMSYLHDRDSNTPQDDAKSQIDDQNNNNSNNNNNNEVKGSLIKIENDK